MTKLFKHNQTNLLLITTLFITIFLNGCSTPIPIKKTPQQIEHQKEVKAVVEQTAEDKLTSANTLNNLTPTPLLTEQINQLLVESSELFLQQQNFTKALWLSNKVSLIVKDNHAYTYRLMLVKVNSLLALNQHQAAYNQIQLTRELVTHVQNENPATSLALSTDYYLALQAVLELKHQPVKALTAGLIAFSINEDSTSQDVFSLWTKLSYLNQWQLAQLAKAKPPFIEGWQQLLSYAHKFGANQNQFARYLTLWQQHYPTHPATIIIEQLHASTLLINEIENIAVLLPLSGNQQSAGIAAQQGILSAYKNADATKIHFIDTNTLDWAALATQFSESNIDHVIGPLLKSNVESFLSLSEEQIALQVPSLLLNLPSNTVLASYQSVLSMQPEAEAIQAASTLSQQNYRHPIILSHQDKTSKRIANAFSQQWKLLSGTAVDIVYFNKGKQMQTSLKKALDVDASQTRIKQLQSRLKNNIKAESRNRRDIDMIYLIGSAAQTQLVKPYIDVNTSPFAEVIPIFASSRSHSNFNYINKNSSTTDLQGLTFTQMPWLLTSKQQDKSLAHMSQQLWPKRSDSLSRLFAMGYDSYNLLPKVYLMQQAPYIRHFGQTGVLKLNQNNVLTRSLIWGRYQRKKVMQIAME